MEEIGRTYLALNRKGGRGRERNQITIVNKLLKGNFIILFSFNMETATYKQDTTKQHYISEKKDPLQDCYVRMDGAGNPVFPIASLLTT